MSKTTQFLVTETVQADGSVVISRKFGSGPVESLAADRAGRLRWTATGAEAHAGADAPRPTGGTQGESHDGPAGGFNSIEIHQRQREAYLNGGRPA